MQSDESGQSLTVEGQFCGRSSHSPKWWTRRTSRYTSTTREPTRLSSPRGHAFQYSLARSLSLFASGLSRNTECFRQPRYFMAIRKMARFGGASGNGKIGGPHKVPWLTGINTGNRERFSATPAERSSLFYPARCGRSILPKARNRSGNYQGTSKDLPFRFNLASQI